MNFKKFLEGNSFDAYEYFGAHLGNGGVMFRTYAPNAERVNLFGDFTGWQEVPMEKCRNKGVWEVYLNYAYPGQRYKFVIYGKKGRVEHCDPYGFGMEMRPGNCSVIRDLYEYQFSDSAWMRKRTRCYDKPLNIYEMHFGSWKRNWGKWFSYSEIADTLISYLKENGYNYVEFMPLSEHPFDGSWGYQNTGDFAPTSRYGTVSQLKYLIDKLHQNGIGAIIDFVPVHFAVDKFGLKRYDGTALYEYPGKKGRSEWGSFNFNHGRGEVRSFLQSAANFWLKEIHFDGIRMDAVSRLIFWNGDYNQGENQDGILFLKNFNAGIRRLHPKAILIAEDSTIYPGMTTPVEHGGMGFDYKWDLGWIYDTFHYMSKGVKERENLGDKISFSFHYGRNERYIIELSHDEVGRGRRSIIEKLHGTYEEKFAQLRLLYMLMMTHPGKKLNFMGNEIAMFREWDENREADWNLLSFPMHVGFQKYMQELNGIYLKEKAMWELDHVDGGYYWVDCKCKNPCVFGFVRQSSKGKLAVFLNFSNQKAQINPEIWGDAKMIINSDWSTWGGETKKLQRKAIQKTIAPYSGVVYKIN